MQQLQLSDDPFEEVPVPVTAIRTWRTWLPPPELERSLLRRVLLFSVLLHGAVSYGAGMMQLPAADPLRPPWPVVFALWGAVLLSVSVTRRRSEALILGNLGVSRGGFTLVVLSGCAALELVLRGIGWLMAS